MKPMLAEIQQAACEYFGLQRREILSISRERRIARPRQIIMYLAREMTIRSYPEIGKSLGGLDHTTVIHGVDNIRRLIADMPETAADVQGVRAVLSCIVAERPASLAAAA